jgi:NifU-like protein involved in Fe-S cluster formation
MFGAAVLDHFQHPRNAGPFPDATTVVEVENPVCGDVLRLAVRIEDGRIAEARFQTRGCVTSIACSSMLTEMLAGKTLAEAAATVTAEAIDQQFGGLPQATRHGAELARDAVDALLARAR